MGNPYRWRCGALARIISLIERVTAEEPEVGAVCIDVWGKVAGEEVHRIACGIGQMREATGLSLSVGTLMLARGELLTEEGGVYAPEACLPPPPEVHRLHGRQGNQSVRGSGYDMADSLSQTSFRMLI